MKVFYLLVLTVGILSIAFIKRHQIIKTEAGTPNILFSIMDDATYMHFVGFTGKGIEPLNDCKKP